MNKLLLIFFVISSGFASAQPSKGSTASYSVLCAEEQSTGFSWENKRWVKKVFRATEKYLVSRVPNEKVEASKNESVGLGQFPFCETVKNNSLHPDLTPACYTFTEIGQKPNFLDSRMCVEEWNSNHLVAVTCSKHSAPFSFEPAGDFIRFPWHKDVKSTSINKDSLSLSVGKCLPIS